MIVNTGPFSNVQVNGFGYWSATENSINSAWSFLISDNGYQDTFNKTNSLNAWAVYSGDVSAISAVPVPGAVWLFGSGLIGLIGIARRKA